MEFLSDTNELAAMDVLIFVREAMSRWDQVLKTLCKYECMILSHDVSKILTACRMLQISIAHRQMKAKIHSFPTMYILGGVDVVEMGQIKVFVQK